MFRAGAVPEDQAAAFAPSTTPCASSISRPQIPFETIRQGPHDLGDDALQSPALLVLSPSDLPISFSIYLAILLS